MMAEYSIAFSERLVDAARFVHDQGEDDETGRAVLYLSCLACEITLKALLERSGRSVKEITKLSHDLAVLLRELGKCKVSDPIAKDFLAWVPATRLRAVTVDKQYGNATVGTVLTAEGKGASKYPNEIRYGHVIRHFPPSIVLATAEKVVDWAKVHAETIVGQDQP